MKPLYPTSKENNNEFSEFKKAEKNYRLYKDKVTDFSDLIDFQSAEVLKKNNIIAEKIKCPISGAEYEAFYFAEPKGFIVIKNYVPISKQLEICNNCLNSYLNKPNRTNMYIYEKEFKEKAVEKSKDYVVDKFLVNDPKRFFFNKKIRWSNIGYQYDWNERKYPSGQTYIPPEIDELSLSVINLLKMSSYQPESVIINYYDKSNYMGGHLDDGEPDQIHPIISFSFGLSCVFLIGGKTKDVKPFAIKLQGGDVCVMSSEARKCYHGVPRILEDSSIKYEALLKYIQDHYPNEYKKEAPRDEKINDFGLASNNMWHTINYLNESRININTRQVYNKEASNSPAVK